MQGDEKQGPTTKASLTSFPDKKKEKEFVNTKPVLQQTLKGLH